ncbi:MAG: MBL fold metallo-hydrolase [Actinomycetota bacterium]
MIWRLTVGRFSLYAIQDGVYHIDPVSVFPDSDSDAWKGVALARDGMLGIGIGCFLVTDGDRVFMVDSGMGRWPEAPDKVRATTGRMPEGLETLGIGADQVEMVIHTHLHADHFGGDVTNSGEAFFPNARLIVHRADVDHFRDAEGWLADRVREEFLPLVEEGRVDFVHDAKTLVPGIAVEMSPGHTPGHISVLIDSENNQALVVGDVMHHPLQVQHPTWNWVGDVDPEVAAQTRIKTVQRLAEKGELLAAGHFPQPGFGRVESSDGSARFEPVATTEIS